MKTTDIAFTALALLDAVRNRTTLIGAEPLTR
jgi:hypothetical protein